MEKSKFAIQFRRLMFTILMVVGAIWVPNQVSAGVLSYDAVGGEQYMDGLIIDTYVYNHDNVPHVIKDIHINEVIVIDPSDRDWIYTAKFINYEHINRTVEAHGKLRLKLSAPQCKGEPEYPRNVGIVMKYVNVIFDNTVQTFDCVN